MKKLTKKTKKRLIILGIILGGFLIVSVAAVEFTSHSGFCSSCHFMEPYFESWETSSHSEFECSVCHYPPGGGIQSKLRKKIEGLVMVGRYWTKLYVKSKPWAEIKDESCLRSGCHEKRLLEGTVPFKKVIFDHAIHFEDLKRGKQLQCTSCHSQIVQGEHITVTESSCFICHFKESEHYPQIDECSHCHDQKTLTDESTSRYNHTAVFDNGYACDQCHSNVVIGDGAVPRENCYKCHAEQERLKQYDDTDLMHTTHISQNKIECNQCHLDIQHKINKNIETIANCETCHVDFHKAQKILYSGVGGKGVDHPMPNVMLEKGLSCKGCHIFHEESGGGLITSDTLVSEADACESCHGEGFSRILKNWEASTTKKVTQVKIFYNRASQEVRRSRHAEKPKAAALMEEALFNIEIVEKGKSVHNVSFSQELLSTAYASIETALQTIGSAYKPESFIGVSQEIPTQCSNCHAGIEENTSRIFGLEFPHKRHLEEQKIDCAVCHSNVREHGEFIATKQSCAQCHHKDTEKDCAQCHKLQATFYGGGRFEEMEVPEDIMAEAGAECLDCHMNDADQVSRSNREKCLDCHEEDYADMFDEWQSSYQSQIKAVADSIRAQQRAGLSEEGRRELAGLNRVLNRVRLDGSSGVHNAMFFDEFLSDLKSRVESLK
jgi:nitrate/TMAO reductase-like tetraheme cytochrome c subunit